MTPPETRYVKSGNIDIAYQVFGAGPLDLVLALGFVTNVELPVGISRDRRFLRAAGDVFSGDRVR